jgi:hypothetical protein
MLPPASLSGLLQFTNLFTTSCSTTSTADYFEFPDQFGDRNFIKSLMLIHAQVEMADDENTMQRCLYILYNITAAITSRYLLRKQK